MPDKGPDADANAKITDLKAKFKEEFEKINKLKKDFNKKKEEQRKILKEKKPRGKQKNPLDKRFKDLGKLYQELKEKQKSDDFERLENKYKDLKEEFKKSDLENAAVETEIDKIVEAKKALNEATAAAAADKENISNANEEVKSKQSSYDSALKNAPIYNETTKVTKAQKAFDDAEKNVKEKKAALKENTYKDLLNLLKPAEALKSAKAVETAAEAELKEATEQKKNVISAVLKVNEAQEAAAAAPENKIPKAQLELAKAELKVLLSQNDPERTKAIEDKTKVESALATVTQEAAIEKETTKVTKAAKAVTEAAKAVTEADEAVTKAAEAVTKADEAVTKAAEAVTPAELLKAQEAKKNHEKAEKDLKTAQATKAGLTPILDEAKKQQSAVVSAVAEVREAQKAVTAAAAVPADKVALSQANEDLKKAQDNFEKLTDPAVFAGKEKKAQEEKAEADRKAAEEKPLATAKEINKLIESAKRDDSDIDKAKAALREAGKTAAGKHLTGAAERIKKGVVKPSSMKEEDLLEAVLYNMLLLLFELLFGLRKGAKYLWDKKSSRDHVDSKEYIADAKKNHADALEEAEKNKPSAADDDNAKAQKKQKYDDALFKMAQAEATHEKYGGAAGLSGKFEQLKNKWEACKVKLEEKNIEYAQAKKKEKAQSFLEGIKNPEPSETLKKLEKELTVLKEQELDKYLEIKELNKNEGKNSLELEEMKQRRRDAGHSDEDMKPFVEQYKAVQTQGELTAKNEALEKENKKLEGKVKNLDAKLGKAGLSEDEKRPLTQKKEKVEAKLKANKDSIKTNTKSIEDLNLSPKQKERVQSEKDKRDKNSLQRGMDSMLKMIKKKLGGDVGNQATPALSVESGDPVPQDEASRQFFLEVLVPKFTLDKALEMVNELDKPIPEQDLMNTYKKFMEIGAQLEAENNLNKTMDSLNPDIREKSKVQIMLVHAYLNSQKSEGVDMEGYKINAAALDVLEKIAEEIVNDESKGAPLVTAYDASVKSKEERAEGVIHLPDPNTPNTPKTPSTPKKP